MKRADMNNIIKNDINKRDLEQKESINELSSEEKTDEVTKIYRVEVRFDEEDYKRLKAAARRNKVTISEFVRHIVRSASR